MSTLGNLVVKIVGDNSEFNKTIAQTQKQLNASTKGLQTVARSITTIGDSMVKGITVPILAVGAGLLKLGKDFDDAYDRIRIDTGATGDALTGLQNDFRAVAKVAPSSFNDISIAVSGYNKTLGLAGESNQKLSTQVLNLSRLTKTDLNANVTESSKVFNNWKISTENQGAALDLLFRASQKAKISVTDLMSEVSSSGPILRTMGYDFETSTVLIAGFQKAGIEVQSTVAAMKIALKNMAKEGFTDPQAVLASYVDKIKNAKTDIEAVGIAAELFGARGGAAMAAAIREGRLNLDDLVASLKTGTETINTAAKATDDWKEKLILLKNNLGIALEPLATKVFDTLTRAVDGVTPKIEKLAEEFGNLSPAMQDTLIKFGLIIAIIPLAISGLSRFTTQVIQVRTALFTMNAAAKLFSGAGMGTLAGWFIALGAALEPIRKSFLTMPDILQDITNKGGMTAENLGKLSKELVKLYFPVYGIASGLTDLTKKLLGIKEPTDKVTLSTEDQKKAMEDAMHTMTAYETAQHQGRITTVEQKMAYQDNENAITSLMAQYPELTRAEAEAKVATDANTAAILENAEANETDAEKVDRLRNSFNKLIDEIFGGITTYNDFQEANWAVEEAQKALTEAIKKYGEGSKEAMQAQNDLDDANITAIETAFKLSTQIGATTEQQEEARNKAIELGLQYVESGAISEQAFLEMASQFGLTSADIIRYADEMGIEIDEATRKRIIYVDISNALTSVEKIKLALDGLKDKTLNIYEVHHITQDINLNRLMGYASGGIVGYAKGGFIENLLSKEIKIPKFDSGGVLAMLHPPEIVLNKDNALNILWNMAQPNKSIQSTENKTKATDLLLHNVINLDGKILWESNEKYTIRAEGERV